MKRAKVLLTGMMAATLAGCGGSDAPPPTTPPPTPTLVSIAITTANATVELGSIPTFTATGTLSDGSTRDITQAAVWSSSDADVLMFNNLAGVIGIGNPRGPGVATVKAAVDPVEGTMSVDVVRRIPRFLYAAGNDQTYYHSGQITAFRIDPTTGSLTAIGMPYPTGYSIVTLAVTHDAKFLYSTEDEGRGSGVGYFSDYAIQPDGSLVGVPGVPFPLNGSAWVTAHPSRDFVYLCGGDIGLKVVAYDPTSGVPTSQTYAHSLFGDGCTIDPNGRYLYPIFEDDGDGYTEIRGFSVDDATGMVSELSSSPQITNPGSCNPDYAGPHPNGAAIDPTGRFIYVPIVAFTEYCPSYGFDAYSIDPVSGALAPIPGSPFASGINPYFATVDASGRFLYVASGSAISVYSIDSSTGVPSEIMGSPFAVGAGADFVVTDPSALYLYVGTSFSGIVGFTIDQKTGSLTPNPGATAAVNNLQYMVVTH